MRRERKTGGGGEREGKLGEDKQQNKIKKKKEKLHAQQKTPGKGQNKILASFFRF